MNVLIYGYGLHGGGFSSAMYFLRHGDKVRLTDIREEKSLGESAEYLKQLGVVIIAGKHRIEDFNWADVVVKTPAISPDNEFLAYSKNTVNDFKYLFSHPCINNVKLIIITGTSGKTLIASAVCFALEKLGEKSRMCGNMGISAFSELEKWEKNNIPEYLICELSATQLRDTIGYMKSSFPNIELIAMTSHIDNLQGISNNLKCIICPSEYRRSVGKELKRNALNLKTAEVLGKRMPQDIPQNLSFTFAILKQLGFAKPKIVKVLKSFKGIPNRAELVKNIGNTLIINDSSSTIPQALAFTLINYQGIPVHLICGGTDDNFSPIDLKDTLKNIASVTLLDGSYTRKKLIPTLNRIRKQYSGPFRTMQDAVQEAMKGISDKNTQTEIVLLSPGASAFELFNDEFDRGDKFKSCFK